MKVNYPRGAAKVNIKTLSTLVITVFNFLKTRRFGRSLGKQKTACLAPLSVCLSIPPSLSVYRFCSLFVCLFVACLSVYLSACVSLLYVCQFTCLSVRLLCLSIGLSIRLCLFLSYLYFYLLVCLFVCLSIPWSVCMSIESSLCLYVFLFLCLPSSSSFSLRSLKFWKRSTMLLSFGSLLTHFRSSKSERRPRGRKIQENIMKMFASGKCNRLWRVGKDWCKLWEFAQRDYWLRKKDYAILVRGIILLS